MNARMENEVLDLVVLTLLEEEAMSAFDLLRTIQDARARVPGLNDFTPGKLAPCVERLRAAGLIAFEPRLLMTGVTRAYLTLTRHGRLTLGLESLAS